VSRSPALALLEFDSVTAGIVAGDAMAKRAPIDTLIAGTVQPGNYLVMVAGDTASVEEAITAGTAVSGHAILDMVFLPDIHPDLVAAIRGQRVTDAPESLGIVETASVAMTLEAADAGVKGATVRLLEIHMADGLGGKAYLLFGGAVADVEAAVEIGTARVPEDLLVASSVISQLHGEMAENLGGNARFAVLIGREGSDAAR